MQISGRIVLVETSHPGNIGAAARAMKTMGLTELALVNPREFPSLEASARASGATDVLDNARVYATLTEAIGECALVIGASARLRSLPHRVVDPRQCAALVLELRPDAKAAIVMGPERAGLTNEHAGLCHYLVNIPTNPEYGSLNVAMAVQVLCYELRMAALAGSADVAFDRDAPLASARELEGFHEHLERVLGTTGFLHPSHPHTLKLRLRRLFQRAELDRNEVNILRGALASLDPEKKQS
jgi:tRNA (cytidine32/uridine32-2'-O)-methyltransferase